jgi:hypothetical protein
MVDTPDALVREAGAAVVRRALRRRFEQDCRRLLLAAHGAGAGGAGDAAAVSEDDPCLQHLLLTLQLVLAHGLRPGPSTGRRWFEDDGRSGSGGGGAGARTSWHVIEGLARLPERERALVAEGVASVVSVNDMAARDKSRLWLLKALMEKHLASSLRVLFAASAPPHDLYEPGALLLHEDDRDVVLGLLDGLEGLDFAFCLRTGDAGMLTRATVRAYVAVDPAHSAGPAGSDPVEPRPPVDADTDVAALRRQLTMLADQTAFQETLTRQLRQQLASAEQRQAAAVEAARAAARAAEADRAALQTVVLELQDRLSAYEHELGALRQERSAWLAREAARVRERDAVGAVAAELQSLLAADLPQLLSALGVGSDDDDAATADPAPLDISLPPSDAAPLVDDDDGGGGGDHDNGAPSY